METNIFLKNQSLSLVGWKIFSESTKKKDCVLRGADIGIRTGGCQQAIV